MFGHVETTLRPRMGVRSETARTQHMLLFPHGVEAVWLTGGLIRELFWAFGAVSARSWNVLGHLRGHLEAPCATLGHPGGYHGFPEALLGPSGAILDPLATRVPLAMPMGWG
eukprot:5564107-Pyramimonas_sp.AAC.1